MTSTTATESTVTADQVVAGDIVVYGTMTGVARRRVAAVEALDVVILYPGKSPARRVFPTVRVTFGATGGESLDYSPESVVTVIR